MKITIFGCGYVGLVTGACLADVGHEILCVDVDNAKIDKLSQGIVPFFEQGLEEKIKTNTRQGRLSFTSDPAKAIDFANVILTAVGTPADTDGSADLSAVRAVAREIGRMMENEKLVVVKSTVPVGSGDIVRQEIHRQLQKRGVDIPFHVASNPEFLKEGCAVVDFERPDRIIIGVDNDTSRHILEEIYAPFNRRNDRMIVMDVKSAELTKYAANAMLATKISFMNEMANIAERVGADIEQVRIGIGSDIRIGYHFIYPGAGYGGSCFPKDVKALATTARKHNFPARIIESVEAVNENQKHILAQKVKKHFGDDLSGKTFAVWGLAFKPGTDDMREAPSRPLMEELWRCGATVRAHDPEALEECRRIYGTRDDLVLCQNQNEALIGADAVIIVTEWKSYWAPPAETFKVQLKNPVVFDGRNIYDPDTMRRHGLTYYAIGRCA